MDTIERDSICRRAIVGGVIGGGLAVAASTPANGPRGKHHESVPVYEQSDKQISEATISGARTALAGARQ
jgi:hypothetical protein